MQPLTPPLMPPLDTAELALIPSAPESVLSPAVARRLPPTAPTAPWRCTFQGVVWLQRVGAAAASMLPVGLQRGRALPWLVGAFVHYTASPVGPYSEVYAGLLVQKGFRVVAHIPFMAVDSLASLRGGRANWALPKTWATFDGNRPDDGVLEAAGEGWQVSARARPFGPTVPMRAALPCVQVRPDQAVGWFTSTISGSARPCRVEVDVASEGSLAGWMRPGRHLATQWANASLTVSPLAEKSL
jgi:hypothetical protein